MKKKKESIDMETWQNTQDIYIDHPVLKQERSRERSLQKYPRGFFRLQVHPQLETLEAERR
jgi:hypothetical protein